MSINSNKFEINQLPFENILNWIKFLASTCISFLIRTINILSRYNIYVHVFEILVTSNKSNIDHRQISQRSTKY